MQGASVKQTRSVCSERARAPAGGRSRCGFAKQIRGFSAQSSNPIQMRCRWDDDRQYPAPTPPPYRGESNSMQGASVKQTRSVCSERARAPAGGRSRCGFAKQIRGFSAQTLDPKRMRCLSNFSWPCLASANPRTAENRTLRGACFYLRKLRPGIAPQNGTYFPPASPSSSTPKPVRSPSQNWVEEGQNETAGGQYDCRR